MRTVIDTNILVRALIRPFGSVSFIVSAVREGRCIPLYSETLLEELVDVLGRQRIRRRYQMSDGDVESLLALIALRGERIVPTRALAVCRDPDDDRVLEVAAEGRAEVIVTADEDLLVLRSFEGIPIVPPEQYRQMIE